MSDPPSADSPFDIDLSAHPHDGFFKAVFSDPDKAGAFFRKHLSEDVVHRIEWGSLTVLPASFVKRDLQQSHSEHRLHSDASLDVEEIYRHLQSEPQLKHTTMSVAEKLIAKGEARGEARGRTEGRTEGKWIGKLQVLEELLGEAVTPEESLRALSLEDLETRYRDCQARYDKQFKRPA